MINPEEKKILTTLIEESIIKEVNDTILQNSPGGKLVVEIENRFMYLDKHYYSSKMGLKIPKKTW